MIADRRQLNTAVALTCLVGTTAGVFLNERKGASPPVDNCDHEFRRPTNVLTTTTEELQTIFKHCCKNACILPRTSAYRMDKIKSTLGGGSGFAQFDDDGVTSTNDPVAPSTDFSSPSTSTVASETTKGSVKAKAAAAGGKSSIVMASFNLCNMVRSGHFFVREKNAPGVAVGLAPLAYVARNAIARSFRCCWDGAAASGGKITCNVILQNIPRVSDTAAAAPFCTLSVCSVALPSNLVTVFTRVVGADSWSWCGWYAVCAERGGVLLRCDLADHRGNQQRLFRSPPHSVGPTGQQEIL
jgi:hypothetical protein